MDNVPVAVTRLPKPSHLTTFFLHARSNRMRRPCRPNSFIMVVALTVCGLWYTVAGADQVLISVDAATGAATRSVASLSDPTVVQEDKPEAAKEKPAQTEKERPAPTEKEKPAQAEKAKAADSTGKKDAPNSGENTSSDATPKATPETAETTDEQPVALVKIAEGQITDYVGRGQAGVTITVRVKGESDGQGEVLATTTSDELGDFAIEVPTAIHGEIVVTFKKAMFAETVRTVRVGGGEPPAFIDVELEGNLVVIGSVRDAMTDKPVSGADVTLESIERDWTAESGDDGRFTIKGVFPGQGELVVESEGYGRETQHIAKLEEFGEIVVTLKPERIVRLAIRDSAGVVVSHATVESYDQPRDDFRTFVSAEDGTVEMRRVHFDTQALTLRVTHDDFVSPEGFDRRIELPADAIESDHDIVMQRAGRIIGTVRAAVADEPLIGARVITGTTTSDETPRDWSDHQGRFSITGVAPGSVVVTVHLTGFAPELYETEVKAGEPTRLDVKLLSAATLRGVVRREGGDPIVGGFVDAGKWRGHGTLGLRAVTDEKGAFVIENAPHDEFEVLVRAAHGSRGATETVKAGAENPIEITIPDAVAGTGRDMGSTLKQGQPAPPLNVTALDGTVVRLTDLKGKIVVLDFWATWCGPCVAELPHLVKAYEKYGADKGFALISISIDSDEKALRDFVTKNKMVWTQVFGEKAGATRSAEAYGVAYIPAIFVIGPDGKLAATDGRGADLEKTIERIRDEFDPT